LYEYLDIAKKPSCVLTSVDETVGAVASICRELDSKAWLFGSQARGRARLTSDIDIAVLSDDFSEVEERVESLDTVFPIDLIDLSLTYKKGIEDAWINIA
jgi:predicted nucleotidyltransferase